MQVRDRQDPSGRWRLRGRHRDLPSIPARGLRLCDLSARRAPRALRLCGLRLRLCGLRLRELRLRGSGSRPRAPAPRARPRSAAPAPVCGHSGSRPGSGSTTSAGSGSATRPPPARRPRPSWPPRPPPRGVPPAAASAGRGPGRAARGSGAPPRRSAGPGSTSLASATVKSIVRRNGPVGSPAGCMMTRSADASAGTEIDAGRPTDSASQKVWSRGRAGGRTPGTSRTSQSASSRKATSRECPSGRHPPPQSFPAPRNRVSDRVAALRGLGGQSEVAQHVEVRDPRIEPVDVDDGGRGVDRPG